MTCVGQNHEIPTESCNKGLRVRAGTALESNRIGRRDVREQGLGITAFNW